ncbi:flavin monoamine oxidase family protein [Nocardioides bruguierae]|uniref:FAD-dependent oxidoreductase n=1 Tax=Nocardioides bruguierae TaxID=2945102 RepID=A0A9X2DAS5_9ACTN|nr:FAD-dependent oxidoreductase [Nocardioides bruguierae]MCM0622306.1 FAD-dependent oxidoreductase [Nocardioides bruguierae]
MSNPATPLPAETDVVVVGAGLSGLRAALELEAAGRDVVVLEGADAVGGRVRTTQVDAFLLDRGFQLLNPAYPAVRRWVDLEALALQPFGAGVVAATPAGRQRLGHPWHAPGLLPTTARAALTGLVPGRAGALGAPPLGALARWWAPTLPRTLTEAREPLRARLDERPDAALAASLDTAGVTGPWRRVLEQFLAGVLLDPDGETSAHLVRLLVSSFLAGTPGLPRDGMQALPEQLAAGLRRPVALGTPAERVEEQAADGTRTVRTPAGPVRARHVVVAGGPTAAAALVGRPAPPVRGVVTAWWALPEPDVPATRADLLHVDARERPEGPLVNAALVSGAAPSYAPAGSGLVAGSSLDLDAPEADLRRHAGRLLDVDPARLVLVGRDRVPEALPAHRPPLAAARAVDVAPGLWWCGDHRDTPSLQGALVSGHRAASAVLAAEV